MPIRPEHRWLYPIDWPQLSRMVRFARAGGRCDGCGRPHGRDVRCLGDGRWWDEERGYWRDGQGRRARGLPRPGHERVVQPALIEGERPPAYRVTRVVLASAHRDHDPGNNISRNATEVALIPMAIPPFRRIIGSRKRRGSRKAA